jgi:hypothetical protein
MTIFAASYQTITCDSCSKSVTFENTEDHRGIAEAREQHPWLKTIRVIQASGRSFVYCGDECELKAISDGTHNPVAKSSLVLPTGANAQQVAAAEAQRAEQATKALKAGAGVTLQGS